MPNEINLAEELMEKAALAFLFCEEQEKAVEWFRSRAKPALDVMDAVFELDDLFGCPPTDADILDAFRKLVAFRDFVCACQADTSRHREVQLFGKCIGLIDRAISILGREDDYAINSTIP